MRYLYLVPICLLFASCGIFSSGQVEAALTIINEMQTQGTVSASQAEALREALMMDTGEPWYLQAGKMILEIGLAVAGVRMWRGPSATVAERLARRAG
tara:strand:+ start:125 stop:418 length:294 start_codon:yes stop_codon:yes gene_type:complete